jgi:hypothetical protein
MESAEMFDPKLLCRPQASCAVLRFALLFAGSVLVLAEVVCC